MFNNYQRAAGVRSELNTISDMDKQSQQDLRDTARRTVDLALRVKARHQDDRLEERIMAVQKSIDFLDRRPEDLDRQSDLRRHLQQLLSAIDEFAA